MASLTGMRIGEVLGLQWQDVDFEHGEIHITHTLCYVPGKGQYLDKMCIRDRLGRAMQSPHVS